MVDDNYERDRNLRMKQMFNLLHFLCSPFYITIGGGGRLLDVGAGSGILVEAALSLGLDCLGVEPSLWLYGKAREHGLPVLHGTMDILAPQEQFDFITLIDVIEHVGDPVGMLRKCSSLLNKNGKLLIVTPDSASLAARLLGYKWWHYRIAHINYFNIKTLKFALAAAGLQITSARRPGWWFTLAYIRERLINYLPETVLPRWKWLEKIQIPINLFDSIAVICSRI
jgi:SAM-dependent methyltransferase